MDKSSRNTKRSPQKSTKKSPQKSTKKSPTKKETIPRHVREEVWRLYGGSVCWCCQKESISVKNKHFGHIIAEKNGGAAIIGNLRPVCPNCNYRMRTDNMYDFMLREGFPIRDVALVLKKVFSRDPKLIRELQGRHVYITPKYSVSNKSYDFEDLVDGYNYNLGVENLVQKYSFLVELMNKGKLGRLFQCSLEKGIYFHFVSEVRYIKWMKYMMRSKEMNQITQELIY